MGERRWGAAIVHLRIYAGFSSTRYLRLSTHAGVTIAGGQRALLARALSSLAWRFRWHRIYATPQPMLESKTMQALAAWSVARPRQMSPRNGPKHRACREAGRVAAPGQNFCAGQRQIAIASDGQRRKAQPQPATFRLQPTTVPRKADHAHLAQDTRAAMPLPSANDTNADLAAALAAAREHFAPQMQQVMRNIRRILAGRDPRQLVGRECLQHLTLREQFTELAAAQRAFAETFLARQQRRLVSEQTDNRLPKTSASRRRIMEHPQTAAIYG
jgi:hypothetical protein